jgi:NADH-quinone oxidoreductase subunit E
MENFGEILKGFRKEKSSLISILQSTQNKYGFIPPEAIKEISDFLDMTESEVFGVASFYAQFRFTKPPRHSINVCLGTACHVKGGQLILDEVERRLGIKPGEVTADSEYGLERVACVGCCALAPVVVMDGKVHGRMTMKKARELVKKEGEKEVNSK